MTQGHPSHGKGARRCPTENQGAQQNPSRADFCEKLEQSLQTETHQEFLFPGIKRRTSTAGRRARAGGRLSPGSCIWCRELSQAWLCFLRLSCRMFTNGHTLTKRSWTHVRVCSLNRPSMQMAVGTSFPCSCTTVMSHGRRSGGQGNGLRIRLCPHGRRRGGQGKGLRNHAALRGWGLSLRRPLAWRRQLAGSAFSSWWAQLLRPVGKRAAV